MWWRNFDNMLSHFHIIPERDGRTDGQIVILSIWRVSVLTRDKKYVRNASYTVSRASAQHNNRIRLQGATYSAPEEVPETWTHHCPQIPHKQSSNFHKRSRNWLRKQLRSTPPNSTFPRTRSTTRASVHVLNYYTISTSCLHWRTVSDVRTRT